MSEPGVRSTTVRHRSMCFTDFSLVSAHSCSTRGSGACAAGPGGRGDRRAREGDEGEVVGGEGGGVVCGNLTSSEPSDDSVPQGKSATGGHRGSHNRHLENLTKRDCFSPGARAGPGDPVASPGFLPS